MTQNRTLAALIKDAAEKLAAADVENPRREARLLLGHATGLRQEKMISDPDRVVDAACIEAFEQGVDRRCNREPMSQILGQRQFWDLTFTVNADVLDPRPETETIIEEVHDRLPDREAVSCIADFGTGSGCLLLTLLSSYPKAEGIGIDASAAACDVARHNADALGFSGRAAIVHGDWNTILLGCGADIDCLVANPPYIPTADIRTLEPEVAAFEPHIALDGGADGLNAYRVIVPMAVDALKPGGLIVLEIGKGQAAAVLAMLHAAGFRETATRRDLSAIDRVVSGIKPSAGTG
ncbi:MAG: peptide chain release factor N(5)-glutamine methyltransferase [Alphaproteobacteria bacterium]